VHEALSHIRNSTRQMDGLLKGLLRLSRSGRVSLNITEVDMNDLLTRVISGIGFALKESGGEIQVDQLPPCLGDSIQLTHVFTNLISNSLKYRHPDRQGLIRIRGAIKGARCVYSVEDNGIGIAEEHQENIFQLFHRLDPSRSEGEGLGLTIVRQIIERLNGAVWVESKLGEGSVFFVSLPPSPNQQHKSKGVFMND
jgi:signal transduction histidine kinase